MVIACASGDISTILGDANSPRFVVCVTDIVSDKPSVVTVILHSLSSYVVFASQVIVTVISFSLASPEDGDTLSHDSEDDTCHSLLQVKDIVFLPPVSENEQLIGVFIVR